MREPCFNGGDWHNWCADGTCTDCKAVRQPMVVWHGSYIKEVTQEVGGGGDRIQCIELNDGTYIVLAYGMLGVYEKPEDFWNDVGPEEPLFIKDLAVA